MKTTKLSGFSPIQTKNIKPAKAGATTPSVKPSRPTAGSVPRREGIAMPGEYAFYPSGRKVGGPNAGFLA